MPPSPTSRAHPTVRAIAKPSSNKSQFRAMVVAMLPFVFGSCHDLGPRALDNLRKERDEILAERKLIIAQLGTVQTQITDLEQQVQELQDKAIVSCYNLLAKDDPLIRAEIEEDCKAICGRIKDTPDSYSSTTEGTFDP